jgi:amino-acid N-acetyltransferase
VSNYTYIFLRKPLKSESLDIKDLITLYSKNGLLLLRDEIEILHSIDAFIIAEHNSCIVGCISYYDYGQNLYEIRSLAVKPEYGKKGLGSKLVASIIATIPSEPMPKIFALSYSPDFFRKNNFFEAPKETLPEKIWKDCSNCINLENCGETALVYSLGRLK